MLTVGLRLAAAPVLAAATGMLGAAGLIELLNEVTPLSVLGIAPAAVIALVLGPARRDARDRGHRIVRRRGSSSACRNRVRA